MARSMGRPPDLYRQGSRSYAAAGRRVTQLINLPFYSPDLNPIEQVFAKVRQFMRECHQPDRGINLAIGR